MTRARIPGGHRRTVKKSEGGPRRVREMKARRAAGTDACRFPDPRCECLACEPDA